MGNIIRKFIQNMKPPTWPIYSWDYTDMLTHAHQDAQRTGHCHWCTMSITGFGYTHADDCELTDTLP